MIMYVRNTKYHQMLRKNMNIFIIIGGVRFMTSFQYIETKYMITVQETARVLGVSVHAVYRLISSGELSAIKVSTRKTVIKAEEIERYLSEK